MEFMHFGLGGPAEGGPGQADNLPRLRHGLQNRRRMAGKRMAERVGFEPTWRGLGANPLSRRARYSHFGTSPHWGNLKLSNHLRL